MLNKKGQTEVPGPSALTSIILVGILFIILLALFAVFILPYLNQTSDREKCRLSVFAASKTKLTIFKSPVVERLECKTVFVEIKKEGIYEGNKKISKLDEDNPQESIKRELANRMHDCWYQMGEGKLDPFEDTNENLRCVICSEISFDKSISKDHAVINDFGDYLRDTNIPGKERKYLNFLTQGRVEKDFQLQNVPIYTSEQYSIIFETSKDNKLLQIATIGIAGKAAEPVIKSSPGIASSLFKLRDLFNRAGVDEEITTKALATVVEPSAGQIADAELEIIMKSGENIRIVKSGEGYLRILATGESVPFTTDEIDVLRAAYSKNEIASEIYRVGGKSYVNVNPNLAKLPAGAVKVGAEEAAEAAKVASRFEGILGKIGGSTLKFVGKVAGPASFALIVYDLTQPNNPRIIGIELVPSRDVGNYCRQLY